MLGGEETEIEALAKRLREAHMLAQVLPYPPIHTPQLSYLRDELMQVIDAEVSFGEQKIPIYSAVTEDFFPGDPEGIRSTALANLDQPVRFWQTIHKMYDAGIASSFRWAAAASRPILRPCFRRKISSEPRSISITAIQLHS